ncbi:putative nuclear pore membrane protein [Violaceomyces palustris]|uniref:Nuclear pore membrane protein n=1 Tax=Violaceomyces palustris TaxID=1673888 RepID=A0ACD0P0X7_9BASI|nr:putative nuclear pore membrane protein [Violaceomyces palustris]
MAAAQGQAMDARPQQPQVQPLIPLSLIDAPSQRFYAVATVIAVQAWKYTRIFSQLTGTDQASGSGIYLSSSVTRISFSLSNSLLLNFTVLYLLSKLGIPRLDPRTANQATPAPSQAGTRQPSTRGLTYIKYCLIFLALSTVDAVLLGDGYLNPANLLVAALGASLRLVATTLGVDVGGIGADAFARQLSFTEGRVRLRDVIQPKAHILGQHTIHILPYSTAKLSPASACYCIGSQTPSINIPVIFNNTEPDLLQYSVTDFVTGEPSLYNVSVSGLVPLPPPGPSAREADDLDMLAAASAAGRRKGAMGDIDADEDELDEPGSLLRGSTYQERQKIRAEQRAKGAGKGTTRKKSTSAGRVSAGGGQLLYQLPIKRVGRIRLERVLDKNRNDARLSSTEALIVECPSSSFVSSSPAVESDLDTVEHHCPGERTELKVRVKGLAPLELEYDRIWNPAVRGKDGRRDGRGKQIASHSSREQQKISHISSPHQSSPLLLPEANAILSAPERLALARERTKAAAAQDGSGEDYSWAASTEVELPMSLDLDKAGTYQYLLRGVKDACGNFMSLGSEAAQQAAPSADAKSKLKIKSSKQPKAPVFSREIVVHPRAKVSFAEYACSPQRPLKLLRNQPGLNLTLRATEGDDQSGAWDIALHFDPDNSSANQEPLPRHPATAWDRNVTMSTGSGMAMVFVTAPGFYKIEDVSGQYCSGEVGDPWLCEVLDVPPPTAKITFSSIDDQCAGPVGVKALSVFTGTPPFKLEYEIKREGNPALRQMKTITGKTRAEIEFRPNTEGVVTYKFLKLADANYKDMELDGPSFTQVVHPLASAKFVADSGRTDGARAVIQSCAGNKAQAEVELGGTGPWDLTYSVQGAGSIERKKVSKITQNRHTLDFELPPEIAEQGGRVIVSLVSIRDGKGCERSLATNDLNIEVRRVKPTVGFLPATFKAQREVEILEGREARLPVRLGGDGPWEVVYTWQPDAGDGKKTKPIPIRTKLTGTASDLTVDKPGLYTLVEVKDAHCPGVVHETQETYRVFTRARPSIRFAEDAGAIARNGSVLRQPVCQGKPDAVDLVMGGKFPLQVSYQHHAPSWSGANEIDGSAALASAAEGIGHAGKRRRTSFSSAQNLTTLELSTITPGWHTYEIESVGDTVYEPFALEGFDSVRPRRLEQMVYPLPGVRFVKSDPSGRPLSFCLGDSLSAGRGEQGDERKPFLPTISLTGAAPFTVDFELHDSSITSRADAAKHAKKIRRTGIKSKEYKLEVSKEEFVFETKGKWSLRVTRVVDGHGCEYSPLELSRTPPPGLLLEMEVADTAGITPASSRDDYCVGEMVDFVLQGTPPWTVTYDFNGKTLQAAVKNQEFSRLAEKAGKLSIKSVAHQQNQCQTVVQHEATLGMIKTIHELPSVRISEGRHYIEDLREGNQAEIVFNFSGVAPFSLTYQRTEPADTYARPKVLETHTVTGILDDKFSIWTSVEGTWSVTWLQDRWCQVSLDEHSGASTPLGKSRLSIKDE